MGLVGYRRYRALMASPAPTPSERPSERRSEGLEGVLEGGRELRFEGLEGFEGISVTESLELQRRELEEQRAQ
eukprot:1176593-Prorocentrum_minimum.AAC.3